MHWGGDYGMGFGGGIFMILFWVLVILGVVYLIRILLGAVLKRVRLMKRPVKYSKRDLPVERYLRKSLKKQWKF